MARTEGQIVEQRAGGVPVRHDRLTALEGLLLRALYGFADSYTAVDEVVDSFIGDGGSVEDGRLLEQLLEEERADRQ